MIRECVERATAENKKIYIRGMGYYGKMLGSYFECAKIKFDGYIDAVITRKIKIDGYACYPPSVSDKNSFIFIAISSNAAVESISEELSSDDIDFMSVSLEDITLFSKEIDDKTFLLSFFEKNLGYPLALENPQTFCEKLNWLKLNDQNPFYHKLADKYEVKSIVSEAIGSEYVVENYGIWDSFDDINFDNLPDSFILKCTHNSGSFYIVKDKNNFDRDAARKILEDGMKCSYFYSCREWVYKDIKPRIIADKLLDDKTLDGRGVSMCDYKFWCFNGVPTYMYRTIKDNDIFENYYDMDYNIVNIDHGFPRFVPEFKKPSNFDEMKILAEKLAKIATACFIRVDFFSVAEKIYFGEFTFYDWAGLRPFASYEQDLELGKLIILPKK